MIAQKSARLLSNLLLKIIIYCVYQPSITLSSKSVLNFKLSVVTFLWLMSCLMNLSQNCMKRKYFNKFFVSNAIICIYSR